MAWQREVAYRRLDEHGEERCVYACVGGMCVVEGMGAAAIDGSGMVFEYRLELTEAWQVRHAVVVIRLGQDESRRTIERQDDSWIVDGVHAVEFEGCEDLDFAFTPTTNSVAIRRLGLAVGQSGASRAVLVTDPELDLHMLVQHYTRVRDDLYRYESGDFTAELTVDEDGVVVAYPGLFDIAQTPVGVR